MKRLHAVLNDAFLEKVELPTTTPTELTELCDLDAPRYRLKALDEQGLLEALKKYSSESRTTLLWNAKSDWMLTAFLIWHIFLYGKCA